MAGNSRLCSNFNEFYVNCVFFTVPVEHAGEGGGEVPSPLSFGVFTLFAFPQAFAITYWLFWHDFVAIYCERNQYKMNWEEKLQPEQSNSILNPLFRWMERGLIEME